LAELATKAAIKRMSDEAAAIGDGPDELLVASAGSNIGNCP